MIKCPSCGTDLTPGSRFCSQCGTKLGEVTGDTTRTITAITDDTRPVEMTADLVNAINELPSDRALLVVQRGPDTGARFLLDTDVTTVGRHPDSDIFLDDITVSRNHVKFIRTDEGFDVQDLGSLNGTYVNRSLVEGVTRLRAGDEVQIGKFRMVFHVSERERR
ncbi:FHA domain-containing protein [Aestuariimicrobium ganziense]|uniref:FHA domain-containing protein n=1 Tax=Aestuariimicrobium ganziense TaxID=2773677 RepID=UPI00194409C4|nr:FHA domain-containing protein [Aestuariimicrobium ganziense]